MTVDRASVDAMTNILRALNGGTSIGEAETGIVLSEAEKAARAADPNSKLDPKVAAMKTILEAFHGSQGDSAPTSAPAFDPFALPTPGSVDDPEAEEAYQTEPTPRGVRIGEWEILVKEGRARKTYDVVAVGTEMAIARDLYLYDAAHGITRRLNEGVAINDARIRDLLAIEEEYAKAQTDVGRHKTRARTLRERGETMRAAVAEDRQDAAGVVADDAHQRLLKLAGLR